MPVSAIGAFATCDRMSSHMAHNSRYVTALQADVPPSNASFDRSLARAAVWSAADALSVLRCGVSSTRVRLL